VTGVGRKNGVVEFKIPAECPLQQQRYCTRPQLLQRYIDRPKFIELLSAHVLTVAREKRQFISPRV